MDAFQEESISETFQAWNEERQLVVEEALENFCLTMGTKWLHEYRHDECEEKLSKQLYDAVMNVCDLVFQRLASLSTAYRKSMLRHTDHHNFKLKRRFRLCLPHLGVKKR